MLEILQQIGQTLLIIMLVCAGVAIIGLALLMRSIRRLRVPREADFFTTLRHVPLVLVVLLDLLDLGLDIFAAPVSWIVLDRMGLTGLRNKAAVEALIPLTGPIPTFTVAWALARLLNLGLPPGQRPADRSYPPRAKPRRPQIIDVEEDGRR